MSSLSIKPTPTQVELATVVGKSGNQARNDDLELPINWNLELIERKKGIREKADMNRKLVQQWYKKNYNLRVSFAPICRMRDYILLDMYLLFCLAAEHFASEDYNKLTSRKQGQYKRTSVNINTLRIQ